MINLQTVKYGSPESIELLKMSRVTQWRRIRDGILPKPKTLSPHIKVWNLKDLEAFINGREA
jgi:predicted DNA-binding transcriptional regulator AlpA